MKKLFLLIVLELFVIMGVNAQGSFNTGVSLGLPVSAVPSTFNVTIDINYLWGSGESFKAGLATGFSNSFGKTTDNRIGYFDFPDIQFLPIALATRFSVSEEFALGADLGYAIGVSEDTVGGFYYAPRAQYSVSEAIDIVFAFRGISLEDQSGPFDVLTLGVEFEL